MTIDPIFQAILAAFLSIFGAFMGPVLDTVKEPYNNFVHTILGNLLGIVAK